MGLDLAAIVRRLQEVETQHPDTAGALDPIIRALSNPEESTVSMEQARELLGVRSLEIIQRWVELGILTGRQGDRSDQWQLPLAEVLRLRGTQRALAEAGGQDLSEEELDVLTSTRGGRGPQTRYHGGKGLVGRGTQMSEVVTLTLPDSVAHSARVVAERTHRRMEHVLVDWLDRLAVEPPVDALPDDQVLAQRDLQMSEEQQEELSALLASQRERTLGAAERARLDDLMVIYRRGLVRKAQAVKVAVERGLQPPLS